jgi:hypothetical protein
MLATAIFQNINSNNNRHSRRTGAHEGTGTSKNANNSRAPELVTPVDGMLRRAGMPATARTLATTIAGTQKYQQQQ